VIYAVILLQKAAENDKPIILHVIVWFFWLFWSE